MKQNSPGLSRHYIRPMLGLSILLAMTAVLGWIARLVVAREVLLDCWKSKGASVHSEGVVRELCETLRSDRSRQRRLRAAELLYVPGESFLPFQYDALLDALADADPSVETAASAVLSARVPLLIDSECQRWAQSSRIGRCLAAVCDARNEQVRRDMLSFIQTWHPSALDVAMGYLLQTDSDPTTLAWMMNALAGRPSDVLMMGLRNPDVRVHCLVAERLLKKCPDCLAPEDLRSLVLDATDWQSVQKAMSRLPPSVGAELLKRRLATETRFDVAFNLAQHMGEIAGWDRLEEFSDAGMKNPDPEIAREFAGIIYRGGIHDGR